jgi:hypothetical protein
MIDLPGQKLHAKRNFINRFRRPTRGAGNSSPLTPRSWMNCTTTRPLVRDNRTSEGDLAAENQAIVSLLENGRALGVKGGALRLDGRVIGFSLGTFITPQVFCVHIEKGRLDDSGRLSGADQRGRPGLLRGHRQNQPRG